VLAALRRDPQIAAPDEIELVRQSLKRELWTMARNQRTSNGAPLRAWRIALGRHAADEVTEAKAQCRAAYGRAKSAGGFATDTADKLWADTLMAVERQPPGKKMEMYARTASLFALLAERETWPR